MKLSRASIAFGNCESVNPFIQMNRLLPDVECTDVVHGNKKSFNQVIPRCFSHNFQKVPLRISKKPENNA